MRPEAQRVTPDHTSDKKEYLNPKTGAIEWPITSTDKGLAKAWDERAQFPYDQWHASVYEKLPETPKGRD